MSSVKRPSPSVSATTRQVRAHAGHSQGSGHHHHDNTYLISTDKNDAGVKITRVGLYVNLGMAITKGVGGYFLNSQALIADGFHALTDLVSDFMTLATISIALKPPTDKYPNGFGKVESFGSLLVSGLLFTGGLLMAKHSGMALYTQFFEDVAGHVQDHAHGHDHGMFGHSHSAHDMIPNIHAAWLAGGSIIVKEWLYRATMKVAKERKSSVLASNAIHHRVDSLTSIVALVAIGGSHVLNGAAWLDPVGGLLVSFMVIQAGWGNTRSAVVELCDSTIDDEVKTSIEKAATKSLMESGHACEVRKVQGIKAGQNYLVDVEVAVPDSLALFRMNKIEQSLRTRVGKKVRGVRRVRVKFVSADDLESDFADEFIPGEVSPRSSPEPEEHHEHQQQRDHGGASGHQRSNGNRKASKRR